MLAVQHLSCMAEGIVGRESDFLKKLFIHEKHEREREAETQAEREAGSMQGPDVGLDPGTPGSLPGPKAGAKPLSHPGIPKTVTFKRVWNFS